MLKKISKHIAHYTPLFGILAISFVGYLIFWYDRAFQAVIIFAASASYVVWGLIHHHQHDELHLSIIVEYISIAALGLIVGLSLIFTA
ncbi:MAG: hypothetical protein US62_C0015G0025 [Candidatus Woesebacteria bacterium GW2011_GWA1_37_8]|uniref:Uncharacterized protein n=1 Tax=Candidatus Woesebacteria bacterium GW2011_GWA1_37_8 TaxID=1618546 RepID=A0A0G0K8I5_9BACT|nr:MAG: hypothetical protein US62_C0015G0025 [Candidatus Woesebacteria bacterium GW2011_GWA1_37_8]